MSKDRKGTTLKFVGAVGLCAVLLGLVLWAQQEAPPAAREHEHDHSDPAQHGHDVAGKALDSDHAEALAPNGHVEDGVRLVEYDAFHYGFDPDPLVVRAGDRVRLLLKSRDVKHGLMIPEVDFDTAIQPGTRESAEFTAPGKPGEYPVFCSVFCGPGHPRMKGRLVVLPAEEDGGEHAVDERVSGEQAES